MHRPTTTRKVMYIIDTCIGVSDNRILTNHHNLNPLTRHAESLDFSQNPWMAQKQVKKSFSRSKNVRLCSWAYSTDPPCIHVVQFDQSATACHFVSADQRVVQYVLYYSLVQILHGQVTQVFKVLCTVRSANEHRTMVHFTTYL